MNHKVLIDNLRSLANLLDKDPHSAEVLDYAYDCYEQIEVLINEIVGN